MSLSTKVRFLSGSTIPTCPCAHKLALEAEKGANANGGKAIVFITIFSSLTRALPARIKLILKLFVAFWTSPHGCWLRLILAPALAEVCEVGFELTLDCHFKTEI